MLYFSETAWTLPDVAAVLEEFDGVYNWRDYEKKIARLIRNAGERVRKQSSPDYDVWWEAIHRLNSEDHYLTAMIRQSGLRPRGDHGIALFLWVGGGCLYCGHPVSALSALLGSVQVDEWVSGVVEKLVRLRNR